MWQAEQIPWKTISIEWRTAGISRMQMSRSVPSHLTLHLDMKLVVSLLLLWATAADPRLIKGNDNSEMKQNLDRLSRNVDTETRTECVQDYSPCVCGSYPEIRVRCYSVTVETLRNVFQRVKTTEIFQLSLYMIPSNDTNNIVSLPADLLGNSYVTASIFITTNSFPYPHLVIDPLAFRSSQNSLRGFDFTFYWNFEFQRDFNFLNGFNKLQQLSMESLLNISAFRYLPPLPSLRKLDLYGCTGLTTFPDLSPAKLESVRVDYCSITDEMADDIVAKLIANSTDSLVDLRLTDNYLTRMPNQLGSPFAFPQLQRLILDYNKIKKIENGTFQGNSRSLYRVGLDSNELVVFEEGVFKELLENMRTGDGVLSVSGNPFACECDMAWIIRDNRGLLPVVQGYCGSSSPFPSVSFQNLDPESFANCAIITTTEKTITTTTTKNPSNGFSCESKPNGDFANPFDSCSTIFYKCSNGYKTEFTCPATTVFNPQTGMCDYPYNVAGCR